MILRLWDSGALVWLAVALWAGGSVVASIYSHNRAADRHARARKALDEGQASQRDMRSV